MKPGHYVWIVPGPAPGKPRMTQRDKWAKRPVVVAYRAWADGVRNIVRTIPPAARTVTISLVARYRVPASWSRIRRIDAIGERKRTKPDPDNIAKAVLDALWSQDAAVGDVTVQRFWAQRDQLEIEIWVE